MVLMAFLSTTNESSNDVEMISINKVETQSFLNGEMINLIISKGNIQSHVRQFNLRLNSFKLVGIMLLSTDKEALTSHGSTRHVDSIIAHNGNKYADSFSITYGLPAASISCLTLLIYTHLLYDPLNHRKRKIPSVSFEKSLIAMSILSIGLSFTLLQWTFPAARM